SIIYIKIEPIVIIMTIDIAFSEDNDSADIAFHFIASFSFSLPEMKTGFPILLHLVLRFNEIIHDVGIIHGYFVIGCSRDGLFDPPFRIFGIDKEKEILVLLHSHLLFSFQNVDQRIRNDK